MKFPPAVLVAILFCGAVGAAQRPPAVDPTLDPKTLEAALAAKSQGAEAERLADRIRSAFGGRDALLRGGAPKIDELSVAWALELAEPPATNAGAPRVARDTGNTSYPMVQVGTTGVYALVRTLSHGTAFTWHYEAGNRRFGGSQLEAWETHPDSREHPGVPKGVVKQMPPWESRIFNGTKRDWWIYVPAQYRAENPAAVMVFQDGDGTESLGADRLRQSDRQERHARHRRRVPRAGRSEGAERQSQFRVRHAVGSVRPVPAGRNPSRGGKNGEAAPRRGKPGDRRPEQRRHLRVHGRVGAPERVQQSDLVDRQLHEHRRGRQTAGAAGTTTRHWFDGCRRNRFA